MLEHTPIVIENFSGLWDRGQDDVCPVDHFLSSHNVRYTQGGVETREGCAINVTLSNIRRIRLYKRLGEASRLLILDNQGRIYDSTNPNTPILTVAGMVDFSYTNFYNRAYISPHNGEEGLPGEKVYVYEGSGSARPAAGVAPTGTLSIQTGATAGKIEAGVHLFAVAFETASGFITKPGPATFGVYTAPGAFTAVVSGIPTGVAGTVVKRHLLSTHSIAIYDGNQDGYEFFFIPNAVIDDNETTSLQVDFYDADLISSADYLFDQLTEIKAGTAVTQYAGRLVVGGADGENSVCRLSRRNDPESFNEIEGFVIADPTEAGGIKTAVEFRNSLYIMKSLRTYVTQDNLRDEPAFWELVTVDKGAGTEPHGISTILDAQGTSTDRFVIADRSGLLLFDGYYHRPELSYKIRDIWARINKQAFNKIQVVHDPVTQSLYIAVPLDAELSPNAILYCDYSGGLSFELLKWAIWQFPFAPVSLLVDVDTDSKPVLKVAGYTGNVHQLSSSYTNDISTAINSYIRTAFLTSDKSGSVQHFGTIRSRVKGSGLLLTTLYGEDDSNSVSLVNQTLSTAPGKEITQLCNFRNEKMSVKFAVQSINEYFKFNKIVVFAKALWMNRYV